MEVLHGDKPLYRSHRMVAFKKGTDPAQVAFVKFGEAVCVVPGDFEIVAGVYDTLSKEHSLRRATLRVSPLHNDPLPGAWGDLSDVMLSLRACYSQRLSLTLKTAKRLQIDVMVNRPTHRGSPIEPRLKVLSEIGLPNGSMDVTLLDLDRRKAETQKVTDTLDYRRAWGAFFRISRLTVSAHALENEMESAQFFLSKIRSRVESSESSEADHAMIVLTAPMTFPKGANLHPIEFKASPEIRVFYLRCKYPVFWKGAEPPQLPSPGRPGPREIPPIPSVPNEPYSNNSDSLERVLSPLHPRLFDVTSASEFRKALAAIMADVSQEH